MMHLLIHMMSPNMMHIFSTYRHSVDAATQQHINKLLYNYHIISQANKYILANLIDSAPTPLDTLREIAAVLNDDADYAATIQAHLSHTENAINGYTQLYINNLMRRFLQQIQVPIN